jgi:hypothetical protein
VPTIVAMVVAKSLQKVGLDRHLHQSDANKDVDRVMPGASPSRGIARVVFWLIFVFFLTGAVAALKIPAVTAFVNQVLAYLPNVIAAIVIFVVAAVIAGAVGAGAAKLMGDTPTGKVVATVVPVIVMVIAMFMILNQLKIAPVIVTIAFAAIMGALALALAFGLGGPRRRPTTPRRRLRQGCRRQGPGAPRHRGRTRPRRSPGSPRHHPWVQWKRLEHHHHRGLHRPRRHHPRRLTAHTAPLAARLWGGWGRLWSVRVCRSVGWRTSKSVVSSSALSLRLTAGGGPEPLRPAPKWRAERGLAPPRPLVREVPGGMTGAS